VHRIIKRYLAGDRSLVAGDASIEELSQDLNRLAFPRDEGGGRAAPHGVARWFASRIGEHAAGNIVSVKPFGLVVQLKGTGATGTVAMEALPDGPYRVEAGGYAAVSETRRFVVGEPIDVRIAGTNEELGRVELEV